MARKRGRRGLCCLLAALLLCGCMSGAAAEDTQKDPAEYRQILAALVDAEMQIDGMPRGTGAMLWRGCDWYEAWAADYGMTGDWRYPATPYSETWAEDEARAAILGTETWEALCGITPENDLSMAASAYQVEHREGDSVTVYWVVTREHGDEMPNFYLLLDETASQVLATSDVESYRAALAEVLPGVRASREAEAAREQARAREIAAVQAVYQDYTEKYGPFAQMTLEERAQVYQALMETGAALDSTYDEDEAGRQVFMEQFAPEISDAFQGPLTQAWTTPEAGDLSQAEAEPKALAALARFFGLEGVENPTAYFYEEPGQGRFWRFVATDENAVQYLADVDARRGFVTGLDVFPWNEGTDAQNLFGQPMGVDWEDWTIEDRWLFQQFQARHGDSGYNYSLPREDELSYEEALAKGREIMTDLYPELTPERMAEARTIAYFYDAGEWLYDVSYDVRIYYFSFAWQGEEGEIYYDLVLDAKTGERLYSADPSNAGNG